jgi:pyruvate/2-oxoglutarate dehydrogenase complex dihydrolipoamide acyltransferase (E2) component
VSSSPTDGGTAVEVIMPALGSSVAEGTVLAWHKRVGDVVAADEALCDVATDKVDSEIPSPCAGRLAAITVESGQTVPVGTVIATIAGACLLYTNPSPRDVEETRMTSSA